MKFRPSEVLESLSLILQGHASKTAVVETLAMAPLPPSALFSMPGHVSARQQTIQGRQCSIADMVQTARFETFDFVLPLDGLRLTEQARAPLAHNKNIKNIMDTSVPGEPSFEGRRSHFRSHYTIFQGLRFRK
jgi:hypothetical protein